MPSMVEAKITKIEVKNSTGLHIIYDGATGKRTEHKIPAGISWELRVTCYGKADAALWSSAVSMSATGIPAAYQKQCKAAKEISSASTRAFDFNMGAMPSGTVTIDRVKYWTSDFADLPSGQGLPPADQW